MNTELPKPASAATAQRAIEMARIWIVDKRQDVVISSDTWKDPGNWGIMLVDLARHVTEVYAEKGYDRQEVMRRVKEAFDAEWNHPTE